MLVPFCISRGISVGEECAPHELENLDRLWGESGVLIDSKAQNLLASLKPQIDKLPQQPKIIWQNLIKKHYISRRIELGQWKGILPGKKVPPSKLQPASQAIIGQEETDVWGIPKGEKVKNDEDFSVTTLGALASGFLGRMPKDYFTSGRSAEEIYGLFLWPARLANKIVVIDRFVGKSVAEGKTANLARLLSMVSNHRVSEGSKYALDIYTESGNTFNASEVRVAMERFFRADNCLPSLGAVRIGLLGNDWFSKEGHDRCLFFDDWGVTVGNGLDVFDFDKRGYVKRSAVINKLSPATGRRILTTFMGKARLIECQEKKAYDEDFFVIECSANERKP